MDYAPITAFTIVSISTIQRVSDDGRRFRSMQRERLIVNYRHEQDIFVRMIDSVTKQVRGR